MASFPPEVLREIFSLLSQSSLFNVICVSKQWNSIGIPLLWRKLHFFNRKNSHPSRYAPAFNTYGSFVRDITLSGRCMNEVDVRLVIDTCSNITALNLLYTTVTMEGIAKLCTKLSEQLECLYLNNCGHEIKRTSPYIAKLKKLKRLGLPGVIGFDDVVCGRILTGCPLLEAVDVSDTDITDEGVRQVVARLPHLRYLEICDCYMLTKKLFDETPWQCTELVELDISYLKFVSSRPSWISSLTSLVSLRMVGSWMVLGGENGKDSEVTIAILAKLPKLRSLDLSFNRTVDEFVVKKIVESCSLTDLNLTQTGVSIMSFRQLSELYPAMRVETGLW